jgi:hypothetical protein
MIIAIKIKGISVKHMNRYHIAPFSPLESFLLLYAMAYVMKIVITCRHARQSNALPRIIFRVFIPTIISSTSNMMKDAINKNNISILFF